MKKFTEIREDWKDIVINNMSEGKHRTEVLKMLNISKSTHDRFYEEVPEYAETFDMGKLLCEAWWDETGRTNIGNKSFNHGLYIFIMKSVFKRRDNPGFVQPTKDEYADEIEKARIRNKFKLEELSKPLN
jgi:hypothetical protein